MTLFGDAIEPKYEILGTLREGTWGGLYKVRHRLMNEVRVVKAVAAPSAASADRHAAAERFLRGARLAIRLRHPNLAVLHDFAVDGEGTAYVVMEYVDGISFLDILETFGPPPLPLTLELARQSLRALSFLHRHQIVHRDISPDNLMLARDREGNPQVKLIDLGIAKAIREASGGLTQAGTFLGKPRYASPEQFLGRGVGPQSDLYSFAVVFYELLTGSCPIEGQDAQSYMTGHLLRPPLDFDESDPRRLVPPDLRQVVLTALAKEPQDRMPGAEDFLRSVARVQERFLWSDSDVAAVLGTRGSPRARSVEPEGTPTAPMAPMAMAPLLSSPRPDEGSGEPEAPPPEPTPLPSRRPLEWSEETLDVGPILPGLAPSPPALEEGAPRSGLGRMALIVAVTALVAGSVGWLLASSQRSQAARQAAEMAAHQADETAAHDTAAAPSDPAPAATEAAEATESPEETPAVVPSFAGSVRRYPPAPPRPARPSPSPSSRPSPSRPAPRSSPPPMRRGDFLLAGPGVAEPVPLGLPRYDYPEAARGSGRRATVRVRILVDEDGKVLEAVLRDPDSSNLGFNEVALDAARRTRFQPGTRGEVPGKMWTELLFEFAE
jgi:eukaryotic-like serine/threonine-protein kinase